MATHPRAAANSIASVVAPSSSSSRRHSWGRPPVDWNRARTRSRARASVSLAITSTLAWTQNSNRAPPEHGPREAAAALYEIGQCAYHVTKAAYAATAWRPSDPVAPIEIVPVPGASLTELLLDPAGSEVGRPGSPRTPTIQDALKILRAGGTFDLLITDQGMPGMTGAELIELVRAERPRLPIILATA